MYIIYTYNIYIYIYIYDICMYVCILLWDLSTLCRGSLMTTNKHDEMLRFGIKICSFMKLTT